MNNPENDKWLDKALSKTIGSEKLKPNFEQWKQNHPHAVETLTSRAVDTTVSKRPLKIRKFIMKNRITKFAAVVIIIMAALLSIILWDKSISSAYAIEQTIKANHGIRFLHIKNYTAGQDEPREGWLEFDQDGNVVKMRAQMPSWLFPTKGDGPLVIVWDKNNENVEQVWNKGKNILTINKADDSSKEQLAAFSKEVDPKEAVKHIQELESQGKVSIEIEEPDGTTEPIIITATYLLESSKPGSRRVFAIDHRSKLVDKIELYQLTNNEYEYKGVIELHDYNQTIDDKMFDLEKEVPPGTIRHDQTGNNSIIPHQ